LVKKAKVVHQVQTVLTVYLGDLALMGHWVRRENLAGHHLLNQLAEDHQASLEFPAFQDSLEFQENREIGATMGLVD